MVKLLVRFRPGADPRDLRAGLTFVARFALHTKFMELAFVEPETEQPRSERALGVS